MFGVHEDGSQLGGGIAPVLHLDNVPARPAAADPRRLDVEADIAHWVDREPPFGNGRSAAGRPGHNTARQRGFPTLARAVPAGGRKTIFASTSPAVGRATTGGTTRPQPAAGPTISSA